MIQMQQKEISWEEVKSLDAYQYLTLGMFLLLLPKLLDEPLILKFACAL